MRGRVGHWLLPFGALAAATLAMYAVRASLDKAHIALVYLLVVLCASAASGRAVGLTLSGLAFLCFDFFFLVPYGTLIIQNPLDWMVLVAFLITSVVAAQLLYRANRTAMEATQRAVEVDRLASLGAETLNAADADEALRAIAAVIRHSVAADECEIVVRSTAADPPHDGRLTEWIIEHGTSAIELGDGTVHVAPRDTAEALRLMWNADIHGPRIRSLAIPLRVRDHVVGVLRIASHEWLTLSQEQARLLTALAYYAALGAERVRLVATAERAEAERRMESLRNALLTAVSHDLRTPLTTIKGAAHELRAGSGAALAEIIEAEADRMNGLVGDLLDLSRIHAGAVQPALALNTVDDLLGAALRGAAGVLRGRTVHVDMPRDELLAGRFDFSQSLRIVVNLLDNAAKYSPHGSPVDVRAARRGDRMSIAVLDRGPGVAAAERARIFEPFYRPPGVPADVRGHGLGLSIARGLAEAQGGSLGYADRQGGGSVFTLELPAAEVSAPAEGVQGMSLPFV